MNKRHVVRLAERERAALRQQLTAGHGRARELLHARILLKADRGPDGPGWTDAAIAAALVLARQIATRSGIAYAGPSCRFGVPVGR